MHRMFEFDWDRFAKFVGNLDGETQKRIADAIIDGMNREYAFLSTERKSIRDTDTVRYYLQQEFYLQTAVQTLFIKEGN